MVNLTLSNTVARERLLAFLKDHTSNDGSAILDTSWLWYASTTQTQAWLTISADMLNIDNDPELQLCRANIRSICGTSTRSVHIVDVGCGDGQKGVAFARLAQTAGYTLSSYTSVDSNPHFHALTRARVLAETGLTPQQTLAIHTTFEAFDPVTLPVMDTVETRRVFIFLGATICNFEPSHISRILDTLVQPGDVVATGVYTRRSNDTETIHHLKQMLYSSPVFDLAPGYLLGLSDADMACELVYNADLNRREYWLRIRQPSATMLAHELGGLHSILTNFSYRLTVAEMAAELEPYFGVTTYPDSNGKLALFVCRKPKNDNTE